MDNIVLNGPNGSSINVGSFLLYDPGADFGEADLLKAAYSENPAAEGAVLAFETVNHRTMQFPLRLASTSAFSGVNGLQAWLRTLARPGATLDVQLEGVASAEAVRFDVYTGRLEAAYDPRQYGQLDRLPATLKLDTAPYGYWPTMILLASAASIGGPGVLALDTTKLIGDVPGLAEIFIAPTSATSYGDHQKTESLYWSLGARPSFQSLWLAASGIALASDSTNPATLIGDQFAPGSQALRYLPTSTLSFAAFSTRVGWIIPAALEPAYRGRFRAYAWARLGPSQALPHYVTLDVSTGTVAAFGIGLASAAPVATVPVNVASWGTVGGQGASPAFSLIDLGELSLPLVASYPADTHLRLWALPATSPLVASTRFDIGGLYLQPLDGAAGVLPRGINQPTIALASLGGRFHLSAVDNSIFVGAPSSTVASVVPMAPVAQHYRGVLPRVSPTTLQLDLNMAGKESPSGINNAFATVLSLIPIRSEPHFAQVSVRYRPRFAFMKGL